MCIRDSPTTLRSHRTAFLNYVSENAEAETAKSMLRPGCQTRVRQKQRRGELPYVARLQTRTQHSQDTDLQPAGRAVTESGFRANWQRRIQAVLEGQEGPEIGAGPAA